MFPECLSFVVIGLYRKLDRFLNLTYALPILGASDVLGAG